VIGLGLIAQTTHLPNLLALPDHFAVTHVCDLSRALADVVARDLPDRPAASTDPHALLSDPAVDAVLIATPGAHATEALDALHAGKHVLAEKPLCTTVAEADALTAAAGAPGLVLQVGYMKMHEPLMARAREALDAIGRPQVVRVTVQHPAHDRQIAHLHVRRFTDVDPAATLRAESYEDERVVEALGDVPAGVARLYRGLLLGSVVHQCSVLRALGVGLPREIPFAWAWPWDPSVAGAEPPSLHAVGPLPGGAVLELSWNSLADYPRYVEEIAVFGSRGHVRLDLPSPYHAADRAELLVSRVDGSTHAETRHRSTQPDGMMRQLIAFHESVANGAPVRSDVAGARDDTAWLQRLTAAIAARAGVEIGGEAAAVRA
jgi:predicted dehydrogenase